MTPALPAMTDDTVTALALAAARGDGDAVEHFVRALQLDVRRFVAYLAQDAQAADDLTQDTFLRALSSLHRFEGRSSARTWLLSIARRVVADSIRYASARPRVADTADWQGAAERTQPKGLPGFDDGVAVMELVDALPRDRREAFVLTQLLGLPYAEAAALGGCPVGTVRSRVSRARGSLTRCLTDDPLAHGAEVEPVAPDSEHVRERDPAGPTRRLTASGPRRGGPSSTQGARSRCHLWGGAANTSSPSAQIRRVTPQSDSQGTPGPCAAQHT